MASVDKVEVLMLKDEENRKDSEKLVRKFEPDLGNRLVESSGEEEKPSAVTTPPVAADGVGGEGEKAEVERQGERKKGERKRRKKKTADEREKEKTVRALVRFLPKRKKKEARKFLAKLTGDKDVKVVENDIFHRGEHRGNVIAVLSRLFLPRSTDDSFFRSYTVAEERRPKDIGHLSLGEGRLQA